MIFDLKLFQKFLTIDTMKKKNFWVIRVFRKTIFDWFIFNLYVRIFVVLKQHSLIDKISGKKIQKIFKKIMNMIFDFFI